MLVIVFVAFSASLCLETNLDTRARPCDFVFAQLAAFLLVLCLPWPHRLLQNPPTQYLLIILKTSVHKNPLAVDYCQCSGRRCTAVTYQGVHK